MNKINQIALTTLLLSLHTFTFADENSSQSKKNQPPLPRYLGDNLPPYTNPNRFMIQGSFIYWAADVDGIDGSLEGVTSSSGATITSQTPSYLLTTGDQALKNKGLSFEWNPGFKIASGVIFGERDEWDLTATWTWLTSKGHRTQGSEFLFVPPPSVLPGETIASQPYLDSYFSTDVLFEPVTFSKTNWKLHYNTIDLDFGRNFFLTKNLTFRPFIGARGAFLHQKTNVDYSFNTLPSFVSHFENVGTNNFTGKNNYNAGGLHGGFDVHWNFVNNFCLFSTLSGSVLYGKFDVKEEFIENHVQYNIAASPAIITFANNLTTTLDNNYSRTRTSLQAILGAMWHTSFYNDKQHLFISAGYEVNEWFQQNELCRLNQNGFAVLQILHTSGNLGLHGINIDVRYDF